MSNDQQWEIAANKIIQKYKYVDDEESDEESF